jgi:hypothetical protein
MSINVGAFDRALRLIVGLVLISIPFVTGYGFWDSSVMKYGAVAVGAVLLATAAMRSCPLYSLFGIRTCGTNGT